MSKQLRIKAKNFAKACGKEIAQIIDFPATGTFSAYHNAEGMADGLGYVVGRLCCDAPVPIAKNISYIAKWYNIEPHHRSRIEGGMVSEDFREGAVSLVIFE